MDDALNTRWQAGDTPFDGSILLSEECTVDELQPTVASVVAVLRREHPDAELLTLLDWHEHDGYVTSAEPVAWHEVVEATTTPERLTAWSSDDTFVRRLVYPRDFSFVLRWCISTDPDDFGLPPGRPAGQCDVAGSDGLVKLVAAEVRHADIHQAKEHFDRAWAG